mgnify:CR=1 FL=1
MFLGFLYRKIARFISLALRKGVAAVVVDEAHTVVQWYGVFFSVKYLQSPPNLDSTDWNQTSTFDLSGIFVMKRIKDMYADRLQSMN